MASRRAWHGPLRSPDAYAPARSRPCGRGAGLQIRHYGEARAVGCQLLLSRYDKLANALGAHGAFVESADDLEPALTRALASGLPACVNVAIEGVAAPEYRAGGPGTNR